MAAPSLPAGTVARVHVLPPSAVPQAGAYCHVTVLARPPQEPTVDAFMARMSGRGEVVALLTHDAGMDWPDKAGVRLVVATLESDGMAMLCFASLADALGCKRRIEGGTR